MTKRSGVWHAGQRIAGRQEERVPGPDLLLLFGRLHAAIRSIPRALYRPGHDDETDNSPHTVRMAVSLSALAFPGEKRMVYLLDPEPLSKTSVLAFWLNARKALVGGSGGHPPHVLLL